MVDVGNVLVRTDVTVSQSVEEDVLSSVVV